MKKLRIFAPAMVKFLFLLYIALGIYLVSGDYSTVYDSQEYENTCVAEWQNDTVIINHIFRGLSEKKEIDNERVNLLFQFCIANSNVYNSGRFTLSYKLLKTYSNALDITHLRKIFLPEEKVTSYFSFLLFTRYSDNYYIYQIKRILI